MPEITPTRSVLRRRGRAFPALPPTTMTSAETLPRQRRHPFRREAGRPQVRAALLHHTVAASTPLRLDHKSFAVLCPLALLGSAFYAVLVHRLVIYAPRFLSTVDYSSAVALHFAHCGQLATGLSPAGVRPCWAHKVKSHLEVTLFVQQNFPGTPPVPGTFSAHTSPSVRHPLVLHCGPFGCAVAVFRCRPELAAVAGA